MNRQRSTTPAHGHADRRSTQRYRAFWPEASLGWDDGTGFRSVSASLRDISLGGAALLSREAPRAGTIALVRLDGARESEWIEATVVEARKTSWVPQTPRLVRLKFRAPCPYDFFTSAIRGLGQEHLRPPHFRRRPAPSPAAGRPGDRHEAAAPGGSRRAIPSGTA
jgi:hypothetical protein